MQKFWRKVGEDVSSKLVREAEEVLDFHPGLMTS